MEVNIGMDETVARYMRTHGVKANKVLSVMGKNRQLINALSNPLGQELLKDVLELNELALTKLLEIDINESKERFAEVRAEYKETAKLLQKYLDKINKYQENLEKVAQNKL
jgi:hypothetical protein